MGRGFGVGHSPLGFTPRSGNRQATAFVGKGVRQDERTEEPVSGELLLDRGFGGYTISELPTEETGLLAS